PRRPARSARRSAGPDEQGDEQGDEHAAAALAARACNTLPTAPARVLECRVIRARRCQRGAALLVDRGPVRPRRLC
ncbi:hypothetical protein, partial [Burkholderia sp. HAN2018]|uniref:hypothetical protein n=1 Tax=Burkholderia sp. HAN2018 TaxID=2233539 RepID=UPI001968D357